MTKTPRYATAIVLPVLAFPACLLCIPPMVWHFSQRNIAAGSLILWMFLLNLANAVNPLIWPRDNILEWWDGTVLCDVQAHIQVGAVVALSSCTAVIARKLAKVMDTSNITIAPCRKNRVIEKVLEIVWCWAYPAVITILYYIVQPVRYYIFGISGCVAAYDASWPSIVVIWMWGPLTTFVAAFYAGLLVFRLYRYRREFHRLITARNTTKSRFMRLFAMSVCFILMCLPYSLFILFHLSSQITNVYDWNVVHGPEFNTILKVPAKGVVRFDRWGEVAAGYLLFLLFGTGQDAHNMYKRTLCIMGLGSIFSSLRMMRDSGSSTSSRMSFAKDWTSTLSSKAKSFFSKSESVTENLPFSTNTTFKLDKSNMDRSLSLNTVSTNEPILLKDQPYQKNLSKAGSILGRHFSSNYRQQHSTVNISQAISEQMEPLDRAPNDPSPTIVYAHAWASDKPSISGASSDRIHIVHAARQAREE